MTRQDPAARRPTTPGRVLVLGNAGMDVVMRVPRLPAPGETLVATDVSRAPGGKGLNQAVMTARAGAEVLFCAPLGTDADGAAVEAALRAEPIRRLLLPRPGPPTDLSVVMVAPDGENCIATAGACADALAIETAERFAASARPGDVLLLQGNLSLAATLAAARQGAAAGARVVLNLAPLRWPVETVLRHCAVVIANQGEAAATTGGASDPALALRAMGPPFAIVTLGARGCSAAWNSDARIFPAPAVQVVDTTGAGDAFCGTLAAALAAGLDEPAATLAAITAATDTVTRPGAYAALSHPPWIRQR